MRYVIESLRHWGREEHFTGDLATMACSLVPPFKSPQKLSLLRRSVFTGQPFAMDLPLASPTRCKLRAVICFLSAKGTTPMPLIVSYAKTMGHSVWTSKSAKVGQRVHVRTYGIHDEQHSGRPLVSTKTIAKVEQEILERLM